MTDPDASPDARAAAIASAAVRRVAALGAWLDADKHGAALIAGALAAIAALAALHASSPAVAVNDMVLDVFVPLDAGWRWVSGQTPHADFHTPVGLAWYAAYGEAMATWGPTPRVLLWVPAIAAPLVALLAVAATRDRLPGLLRAATALYLGLVALSPRHLDRDSIAHLASYNRVGWAVCAGVLLLVALPPRGRRHAAVTAAETALAIAALVLLFFLKVTYFGLAGLGVLLAVALVPRNRGLALAAGVGAWAVIGAAAALSPLPLAYVADIRAAAASFDPAWAAWNAERMPGMAKAVAAALFNGAALLGTIGGLLLASRSATDDTRPAIDRAALLGLALSAAVVLTTVQSHDHYAPAAIVGLLLALSAAPRPALRGALALLALWVVGRMAVADVTAILAHRAAASSPTSSVPATSAAGTPLAGLRWGGSPDAKPKLRLVRDGTVSAETFGKLVPTPSFGGTDLQLLFDEGLAALAPHPGARVLSVSFAQPFAWATGAPPPRGGPSWYDPGRSFGGDNPLDPDVILADVDVVLVPEVMELPVAWAMWEQLGPTIEARYTPERGPVWTAWVKRPSP